MVCARWGERRREVLRLVLVVVVTVLLLKDEVRPLF